MMEDVVCEAGIRNLRLGTGGAAFLANLLNPAAHNMHHFRVGSALCPGTRGCDWRAGDLARQGHASLLRIRLEHLAASADSESILVECNSKDADEAIRKGHLAVVRDLRAHGIRCTSEGANWAARNGHVDVIRDLRAHDIHCTANGADRAAERGGLDVIQDLRAHSIHCTAVGRSEERRGGKEWVSPCRTR